MRLSVLHNFLRVLEILLKTLKILFSDSFWMYLNEIYCEIARNVTLLVIWEMLFSFSSVLGFLLITFK